MLIDLPKIAIAQPDWWAFSPPVPVLERPVRKARGASSVSIGNGAVWRGALDALTNTGEFELEYDDWFHVICGINYELDASDEALDLAIAWSARSGKHDETFLTERVWPYIRSDRGGTVVTGRTIMALAARLHGWSAPLTGDAFGVVEDDDGDDLGGVGDWRGGVRGVAAGGVADGIAAGAAAPEIQQADDGGTVQAGAVRSDDVIGVEVGQPAQRRGGIPDAEHLTTDQANANRLVRLHGRRLLVAEGRWHAWDGHRWLADESDVYRATCQLSRVVREEAQEWDRRVARLKNEAVMRVAAVQSGNVSGEVGLRAMDVLVSGEGGARAVGGAKAVVGEGLDPAALDEMKAGAELADSLHKWSVKSEMKVTIEAAVGLSRKMLTVETEMLDADPWLLNTPTGVVDLRSGEVRRAKPGDLLTKLTGVGYVAGADQSVWRRVVLEVCGGDAELAAFLQRWLGYCATGSVREQVFVVHWGGGRNGKSTLLDTVARVLGDYADTAAPGLMASGGRVDGSDRHPTEIAGLRGRRMVTAHESGDGAVLREDFIKHATGSDRLKARFMREDFFEFVPTHKLQLLTNHKPAIKTNDPAMWRRVLLVPYVRAFGDVVGEVGYDGVMTTDVADKGLGERLVRDPGALAGVMAWLVDGAVAWAAGGLQPPAVVRVAVQGYKVEQDRLGQFVRECCEVAPAEVLAKIADGARRSVTVPGVAGWWQDAEVMAWSEPLASGGLHGLYGSYGAWCKESGGYALGRNRFGEALERAVPGLQVRDANVGVGGGRRRVVRVFGLKLLAE